ncbi:UDP-galactopyranose mutase [Pelomonas sp. HMWF004]|nr:UDP-galactopyranose mutase [Pelomonas sp. HMWF004]
MCRASCLRSSRSTRPASRVPSGLSINAPSTHRGAAFSTRPATRSSTIGTRNVIVTSEHTHDHLIVGAGFAGVVCARVLADAGRRVLVIDRRPHIAGNAHDRLDAHGVLIHDYGPHIFHTNSKRVFEFLSRFTDWRFYEHRVLAKVDDQLLPIPINRTTINQLYGLALSGEEVIAFLERAREPRHPLRTSEDVVLNSVGRDLCDKFFRGYTRKQWGLDLSELSAGVAARIPTRTDDDDRYFNDSFQFMPAQGYTALFERMLDHPGITLQLACDHATLRDTAPAPHTVYTGPIDAYFEHCFGALPYRSLRFEHEHRTDTDRLQPVGTVNYPNDHAYTRVTEFKHLTGQQCAGTSIVREYAQADGDPYYPIPRPENEALYRRYAELAERQTHVTFVGRLAQYRYYNMDQIVAAALTACEGLLTPAAPEPSA